MKGLILYQHPREKWDSIKLPMYEAVLRQKTHNHIGNGRKERRECTDSKEGSEISEWVVCGFQKRIVEKDSDLDSVSLL